MNEYVSATICAVAAALLLQAIIQLAIPGPEVRASDCEHVLMYSRKLANELALCQGDSMP